MEVITIDSIAFQKLVEQLNRIESYVERTTELYRDRRCLGNKHQRPDDHLLYLRIYAVQMAERRFHQFQIYRNRWCTFFIQFPVHGNKVFPHKDSGYGEGGSTQTTV